MYLIVTAVVFTRMVARLESVIFSPGMIVGLISLAVIIVICARRNMSAARVTEVIASAGRIPIYYGSLPPSFTDELNRARRYQHSLTLIVVTPTSLHVADSLAPRPAGPYVWHPVLGCILRSSVRQSDLLAYHSGTDRYVLLVQVDHDGAVQCVNRMKAQIRERTGVTLQFGVASFPDDALTLEDLLNAAMLPGRASHAAAAPTRIPPAPLQPRVSAAVNSRSPRVS